jgi:hypothetical protein
MDFFKKTIEIEDLLKNSIFTTLNRMLNVVKAFPEQLVTALRIIEREEIGNGKRRKQSFVHQVVQNGGADYAEKRLNKLLTKSTFLNA